MELAFAKVKSKQALAKSPLTKKYDLSSIVEIQSGAAPLGGEVIQEAEALWPTRDRKLKVCHNYVTIIGTQTNILIARVNRFSSMFNSLYLNRREVF